MENEGWMRFHSIRYSKVIVGARPPRTENGPTRSAGLHPFIVLLSDLHLLRQYEYKIKDGVK